MNTQGLLPARQLVTVDRSIRTAWMPLQVNSGGLLHHEGPDGTPKFAANRRAQTGWRSLQNTWPEPDQPRKFQLNGLTISERKKSWTGWKTRGLYHLVNCSHELRRLLCFLCDQLWRPHLPARGTLGLSVSTMRLVEATCLQPRNP